MHPDIGPTTSCWTDTNATPRFPELGENVRTHVCIVGAGIAGLTTAYLLARTGKAVVVVDDGRIGGGETGRTTAHLTAELDDRYTRITFLHGEEGARLAAESHTAAIQRIEAIVHLEDIECDFERVDGFLILGAHDRRSTLDDELAAVRQAGITDAALFERAPLDFFDTGPALRFPRQGQFHPLKYLTGLARAFQRDGGTIYGGTKVTRIDEGENDDTVIVSTTSGHTIVADDVVVATNSPVNDWMVIHTKQAPYRTYVVAFRIPAKSVPHILLWDTEEPYHYVRVHPMDAEHDLLIVGGEDHKTGQANDAEVRFRALETWARARFPMIGTVEYQWSGQVLDTVDALAFMGKNPGNEHIYVITGTSGNGMTNGTIGGILVTDLITGRESSWAKLYEPSRITLRSGLEFAKENLNVADQYRQYITKGDVGSADDIPPGSGAVIRRGVHKIAVYKDESGAVQEFSAVCPHLYCIVEWNAAERSWDCPCHGSRFTQDGIVVNGPAIENLKPPSV